MTLYEKIPPFVENCRCIFVGIYSATLGCYVQENRSARYALSRVENARFAFHLLGFWERYTAFKGSTLEEETSARTPASVSLETQCSWSHGVASSRQLTGL